MVLPITTPPTEFTNLALNGSWYLHVARSRRRQKMPIDRPLPYALKIREGYGTNETFTSQCGGSFTRFGSNAYDEGGTLSGYSSHKAHAYNQAYGRLRGALSDQAGWAENLAQINKTRSLVIGRAIQLGRFAGALRRGNLSEAGRVLQSPIPSKASKKKKASQNFLEWEYGIKPIISDLQNSLAILGQDFGVKLIAGHGRSGHSWATRTVGTVGAYGTSTFTNEAVFIGCRAQAWYRIVNPNLFLANSLGLMDLALPWKLIPFSFVVDWFVNVEQVISSVSDWYGVELLHPCYTYFGTGHRYVNSRSIVMNPPPNQCAAGTISTTDQKYVAVTRTMGLPSPTLVVKPFKGFSITRGAQAIALVLSVLGK